MVLGEEEIAINSEINLENVAVVNKQIDHFLYFKFTNRQGLLI